jgi:hypothetical protein
LETNGDEWKPFFLLVAVVCSRLPVGASVIRQGNSDFKFQDNAEFQTVSAKRVLNIYFVLIFPNCDQMMMKNEELAEARKLYSLRSKIIGIIL